MSLKDIQHIIDAVNGHERRLAELESHDIERRLKGLETLFGRVMTLESQMQSHTFSQPKPNVASWSCSVCGNHGAGSGADHQCVEDKPTVADPDYRMLSVGEVIRDGDEWSADGLKWHSVFGPVIGARIEKDWGNKYRRRIAPDETHQEFFQRAESLGVKFSDPKDAPDDIARPVQASAQGVDAMPTFTSTFTCTECAGIKQQLADALKREQIVMKQRAELTADLEQAHKEQDAVWNYMKPSESNDMPWSDEIIICYDHEKQRADEAEKERDKLRAELEKAKAEVWHWEEKALSPNGNPSAEHYARAQAETYIQLVGAEDRIIKLEAKVSELSHGRDMTIKICTGMDNKIRELEKENKALREFHACVDSDGRVVGTLSETCDKWLAAKEIVK